MLYSGKLPKGATINKHLFNIDVSIISPQPKTDTLFPY